LETEDTMTRAEHLAWAKERAKLYLELDETINCVSSMTSDVQKHPELLADEIVQAYCRGGVVLLGITAHGSDNRRVKIAEWLEAFPV
jgi:hypothetical protein